MNQNQNVAENALLSAIHTVSTWVGSSGKPQALPEKGAIPQVSREIRTNTKYEALYKTRVDRM